MIHKLILKNFKRIKSEVFEFHDFDLIVGANNSGKSTALQALAIWQYSVNQFQIAKKKGSRGIQVVLPNFTALPLPEFNLLWTDRTDREYISGDTKTDKKKQNYIYIEIDVYWHDEENIEQNFCVQMRYQSPQAVFAIPEGDWANFTEKMNLPSFPKIVYVPPFSGLEPHESWIDDGNIRQQIGKAQPGSVLRNLLYRVIDRDDTPISKNEDWQEIESRIKEWFGIDIKIPSYEKGISTEIIAEYKSNKKTFDVISGGSGFHQILTLLAFVYGYSDITTILLDEPDAHLHVNLQRQIVNYFKLIKKKQFIIATHSEEFIKRVEIPSILSMLSGKPSRVNSNYKVLHALSDIDNIDVVRTQSSPYILYLEGEDDERLLSSWANILGKNDIYEKFYPFILGGSTKKEMKEKSDRHFDALKQINPDVKRALLLDYDNDEVAINPSVENIVLNEWKRKNIDNYLFIPDAWKRAICNEMGYKFETPNIYTIPYFDLIDSFFNNENLTLPKNSNWLNLNATIFKVLDGKKLLFENKNSLFEQIRSLDNNIKINRLSVANHMKVNELHQDIVSLFENLSKITQ